MKLTDLRVGNLVMGYDGKVFEWSLFHFKLITDEALSLDEMCMPITMTDKILIDFGFEKVKGFYDEMFFQIKNGKNIISLYETEVGYEGEYNNNIEFVHHLQNYVEINIGLELKKKTIK
jgi:hypothetical protein